MSNPGAITVRPASRRGLADHGWLVSHHTFSFADYYDSAHMGFRSLRVINEDIVAPEQGFGAHPHRDMEIFSYVRTGILEHKDSLGNGRQLLPGEIQLMSAGTGVVHSEYNASTTESLRFLQIWIQPREQGLVPSYTEWRPEPEQKGASKVLVISADGRDGSALIHQDVAVYRIRLVVKEVTSHVLTAGRGAWLQVVEGLVLCNEKELREGDGASTETEGMLTFEALEPTELLLFDLGK